LLKTFRRGRDLANQKTETNTSHILGNFPFFSIIVIERGTFQTRLQACIFVRGYQCATFSARHSVRDPLAGFQAVVFRQRGVVRAPCAPNSRALI
jgi:hypothetical protein